MLINVDEVRQIQVSFKCNSFISINPDGNKSWDHIMYVSNTLHNVTKTISFDDIHPLLHNLCAIYRISIYMCNLSSQPWHSKRFSWNQSLLNAICIPNACAHKAILNPHALDSLSGQSAPLNPPTPIQMTPFKRNVPQKRTNIYKFNTQMALQTALTSLPLHYLRYFVLFPLLEERDSFQSWKVR